jgi:hypothetical protein
LTKLNYIGPGLPRLRQFVSIGLDSTLELDFQKHYSEIKTIVMDQDRIDWVKAVGKRSYALSTDSTHEYVIGIFFTLCADTDHNPKEKVNWPDGRMRLATPFMVRLFFSSFDHVNFSEALYFASQFRKPTGVLSAFFQASSVRWLSWCPHFTKVDGQLHMAVPQRLPTAVEFLKLRKNCRPQPQVLHVSPIGNSTVDAVYENAGTIMCFQMTVGKQHDMTVRCMEKLLDCFSGSKVQDFMLIFIVPTGEAKFEYLTRYKRGKKLVIGGKEHILRVGTVMITEDQIKELEVSHSP